jgi:hypothetical protein
MIADVVVDCPYCGESFGTLVDGSAAVQEGETSADYYEDCAVCCRPIRMLATFETDGSLLAFEALTDAD